MPEVLPGCKSVICLAINYYTGSNPFPEGHPQDYRIAKYSWNNDYHDLVEKRLADFDSILKKLGGTQLLVDTGPVLERFCHRFRSWLEWEVHRPDSSLAAVIGHFLRSCLPLLISPRILLSETTAGNAPVVSTPVQPRRSLPRINLMLAAASPISP